MKFRELNELTLYLAPVASGSEEHVSGAGEGVGEGVREEA